jgi:hypothetical protein
MPICRGSPVADRRERELRRPRRAVQAGLWQREDLDQVGEQGEGDRADGVLLVVVEFSSMPLISRVTAPVSKV